MMNRESLDTWLRAYGQAWKSRSPQAIGELFTEDATYLETPFVKPLRGRAAIRDYWTEVVVRSQQEIQFGHEVLVLQENTGIAHWWASFVRIKSGKTTRLDGVFLLAFDSEGCCTSLREWWHRIEEPNL